MKTPEMQIGAETAVVVATKCSLKLESCIEISRVECVSCTQLNSSNDAPASCALRPDPRRHDGNHNNGTQFNSTAYRKEISVAAICASRLRAAVTWTWSTHCICLLMYSARWAVEGAWRRHCTADWLNGSLWPLHKWQLPVSKSWGIAAVVGPA